MTVKEVKSLSEFQTIINGDRPAVFDFWATWCGPCRMISPIFEKLSESELAEKVDFYKVDVDAVPDVSQEAGIKAMPTFKVYQRGKQVGELVGANPAGLQTLLNEAQSLA